MGIISEFKSQVIKIMTSQESKVVIKESNFPVIKIRTETQDFKIAEEHFLKKISACQCCQTINQIDQ